MFFPLCSLCPLWLIWVKRDAGGEGFGVFEVVGGVCVCRKGGPLGLRVSCPEAHGAFVVDGGDFDFHDLGHGRGGGLGPIAKTR